MKKQPPKKLVDALAEEVLQRRAQLQAMTMEEKAELFRQEAQKREAEEVNALRIDEAKIGQVMDVLTNAFRNSRPRTPAELAEYRWRESTAPSLAARGLPERLLRRITVWNQEKQESVFVRTKAKLLGVGAIVALCGARGLGKSTIAAQIMRERMEARQDYALADLATRGAEPPDPGRYEKLVVLGNLFKPMFAGFGSIHSDTLTKNYGAWCRVELLTLDEMHDAEGIAPAMTMLVDLIDRRYSANLDTILISNRPALEFRDQTNPSIISRLGEHGAIISCDWPSWRVQR